MGSKKEDLFSSFDIGHLQLTNRFAVAPMTRVSATDSGAPTEEMIQYYDRFARGGFGLVITEGLYIDKKSSQGYLYQPGISDVAQAQAWKPLVERAQGHGAKVIAQIMHAGALSQGNRFADTNLAASAIQPKGEQMGFYFGQGQYKVPQAMTEQDIADVIASFVTAARLAVETAGFDGVEIHSANGYLLDQFLTDYTNERADAWGGGLQARLSFPVAVLTAVKTALGTRVPVGIRISQGKVNDFFHKWAEGEEGAKAIFSALKEAGADYLHVTEFEAWKPAFEDGSKSLVSLARESAPGVAIIANGNLHLDDKAVTSLDEGADVIALGKAALANPDLPIKLATGTQLAEFDSSILGPIANIKKEELALALLQA